VNLERPRSCCSSRTAWAGCRSRRAGRRNWRRPPRRTSTPSRRTASRASRSPCSPALLRAAGRDTWGSSVRPPGIPHRSRDPRGARHQLRRHQSRCRDPGELLHPRRRRQDHRPPRRSADHGEVCRERQQASYDQTRGQGHRGLRRACEGAPLRPRRPRRWARRRRQRHRPANCRRAAAVGERGRRCESEDRGRAQQVHRRGEEGPRGQRTRERSHAPRRCEVPGNRHLRTGCTA